MEELKNALGQCFWVGINGTEADEESTRAIFKEFQPAGIILFQRNVESIEQVQRLNRDLQKQSSIPLLIAVDQEGGVVERLHKIIGSIPPAMAFTASGSKLTTRRLHQAHAR
ncbi:MAG TPA: glycoside hydrolase family 3 N-terminal domain-containing protein, partial [Acidobacteriota bacterium]|nr:glycoside hydrolase family 3 N-terminal domain-containing protein [Acidobacteriota bacterium]